VNTQKSTQEQLNKLIEFRQTVYEQLLTSRQDAQFEASTGCIASERAGGVVSLAVNSRLFSSQVAQLV
jgi:hypothetical protein